MVFGVQGLVSGLEGLGLENVRTYIQSGNVVFQSTKTDVERLSRTIKAAVGENHGFSPEVMVLSVDELSDAVARWSV